jgi:hypothetical protein
LETADPNYSIEYEYEHEYEHEHEYEKTGGDE